MTFYILSLFVIPLVIFVNKKLYWNIKNEEHLEKGKVIQYMIKTYAIVQCIIWPCIVLACGLIKLIAEYSPNLPISTIVSTFRFLYTFFRDFLQFHSLIIAITRYIFIVFEGPATKFGIQKIRKVVISASIGVPFLTAVLYELTCPIEKTYLDWFYNEKYSVQLQNNSEIRQTDPINDDWESTIFIVFNNNLSSSLISIVSIFEHILFAIIYSNTIEGCIYIHIAVWFQRYNSNINL